MTIRETFRLIRSDYNMLLSDYNLKPGFVSFFKVFFTPSLTAVYLFRFSHYFYHKNLRFIARFFYCLNVTLTGADINPRSIIGEGLVIIHPVSILIHCKIGRNCILCGQNALGGDPLDKPFDVGAGLGLAVIGDNVFVGVGAKIIGPIKVGDNVTVGAAALVIDSVPDNAIVGGVPAKVLRFRDIAPDKKE